MQSAIKLAAYGLIAASFSKLGNMGVQALGVGHDQDEMGYYLDDAALRVAEGTSSVSDLTNTADFATVSTFEAIDPTLITKYLKIKDVDPTSLSTHSLDTYTTETSTVFLTATVTAASEVSASETTSSETSVAVEASMTPSSTGAIWVTEQVFTSTWKTRVTFTRAAVGLDSISTTCTTSSDGMATSTTGFDGGITATTTSDVDAMSGSATGTFFTGVSSPVVASAGTAGTSGVYPSLANGTWTAPTATSTFHAGAMGMKMAGANIIGAAAVAAVANLL